MGVSDKLAMGFVIATLSGLALAGIGALVWFLNRMYQVDQLPAILTAIAMGWMLLFMAAVAWVGRHDGGKP